MFDNAMVSGIYTDIEGLVLGKRWQELGEYYKSRCIITPLNPSVAKVNNILLTSLSGEVVHSYSIDTSAEDTDGITPEILNTFAISTFLEHLLALKAGMVVIVLRNLNFGQRHCNGTRLLVTYVGQNYLQCIVISGPQKGLALALPRINLLHKGKELVLFYCYQYPVALAFCITINKAQGQSLERVCVLLPAPVFSHSQLYVAFSWCTDSCNISVCSVADSQELKTLNIVHQPILAD